MFIRHYILRTGGGIRTFAGRATDFLNTFFFVRVANRIEAVPGRVAETVLVNDSVISYGAQGISPVTVRAVAPSISALREESLYGEIRQSKAFIFNGIPVIIRHPAFGALNQKP